MTNLTHHSTTVVKPFVLSISAHTYTHNIPIPTYNNTCTHTHIHRFTQTQAHTPQCTQNNPVHELCIARGSMHTTHIQHRELQTADITRIIINAG